MRIPVPLLSSPVMLQWVELAPTFRITEVCPASLMVTVPLVPVPE